MADRIPLIVNTAASQIQELASTDNLTFASKLLVTNATDSTSKDTGSTIIDGGVGIEKNLHVGGTGTFTGNVTAPTFVGNLNGIASNATLVDLNNDTGSTYRQLIFTSSNAATTAAQLLVDNTSSGQGIQYRPSDNTLRVDGDIIAFHTSDVRVKKNLEKIKDPIAIHYLHHTLPSQAYHYSYPSTFVYYNWYSHLLHTNDNNQQPLVKYLYHFLIG